MKTPPSGSAAQLRPLGLVISGRVRAASPSHRSCADRNTFKRTLWNRTSWTGKDGSSLSLCELPCYFEGTVDWTSLGIFESPTHTLTLWSSLISQPLPTPDVLILHAPLLQCSSAKQRIKKCVLYWKDSETKEKIVIHSFISIILSKENSDAESHLKFTMSFSLRFLKAQVGCRSSWGRCWRLSVALG